MEVNKAMLDDITTPTLGFNIAKVLELIVEADPNKNSVINNNTSFIFRFLYFFP